MRNIFLAFSFAVLTLTSCASGSKTENQTQNPDDPQEHSVSLISKEQFLKEVWNYEDSPNEWKFLGDKPVIIDFYADWCGPCKIAGPILEDVAKEYDGKVIVYKIDTQRERELASVFGISSIPAFLYIPVEGKPMMTAGIGRTKDQTRQMFVDNIESHLLKNKQ
ncbi:thioredoxin family protein [Mangrovibacterium diazotrophicum]|uniref:Thioredoxin n=1 Tax=Mangrovibacterium diazotrophicum TaxID=1261403 RepID=A0A419W535_9BACT|nr:thioredoxin domain-containing protein [Mangrovibacterium diazotrophicum]RKD90572.1 thioredoxin [Mangrovibacterium diazotrophicum]